MKGNRQILGLTVFLLVAAVPGLAQAQRAAQSEQQVQKQAELDQRVPAFLEKVKDQWRDMNVPEVDGKLLHDIIVQNNYKQALEIGMSTGRSAIWIAWALSKTGGKLITIEIDERRYQQALANFKEAGVSEYIDARLADAHTLVPQLSGPFDFVFIDADKDWYINYAKAVIPNLQPGGCIAAHNIPEPGSGRSGMRGTAEYFEYMKSLPEFDTKYLQESQAGVAVSVRKKR
ncbi:MAG: O-methyltransferase [Candidatus Acidiferrales bacterium]